MRKPEQGPRVALQILHSASGFVQDNNTAASSMVTSNVFLSVAKNLEKKGRATDCEHVTFVSY